MGELDNGLALDPGHERRGQVGPGQLLHQPLLEPSSQLVDLSRGGGEVRLELELPLPQALDLPLGGNVLPQQLQLLHLQPGDLALQLVELPGHHPALHGHHCHVARHHLLAPRVQH